QHVDAGSMFLFGDKYTDHFFAFKVSRRFYERSPCLRQVLPVVIFFSTIISMLYYLGVMQVIIHKVAWVMQVAMGTTAGESLTAAANIF
ncbi:hypothetical protein GH877_30225, partial [Bacillus thuringiensis]|nr:hypothetical protein [Bacillus thuringiensis]